MMNCDFCNENSGVSTIYNEIYGEKQRTVYESKTFKVFPCMGQLREGHLLIATKAHVNSIGQLEKSKQQELENIMVYVTDFYREKYNMEALCFEHGALNDSGQNGGCGIYHMHMHMVPIKKEEYIEVISKVDSQRENHLYNASGLSDTSQYVREDKTYIFIEYINEQSNIYSILVNDNNYFESQYMRRIVGETFHVKEWDWKKNKIVEPEFICTLEKAKTFFEHL